MRNNAWIALAIVGIIIAIAVSGAGAVSVITGLLASTANTGTTSSPSGMEIYTGNGLKELTLLRGCSLAAPVLRWQADDEWACDSTTSGALRLDQIDDPNQDKTFDIDGYDLAFENSGSGGAFIIRNQTSGTAQHLVQVLQEVGNPGAGTDLLHVEAEDNDVLELHLLHTGDQASSVVLRMETDRATPTNGDEVCYTGQLSDSGGTQTEFARMCIVADDVDNLTEDGKLTWDLIQNASLVEVMTLDSVGNLQVDGSYTSDALAGGGTQCLQSDNSGLITGTGSGCSAGSAIDVELNGTVAVTGTQVVDFLSPFDVVDDGGDAQVSLPLADDNAFVGNAGGVPTATAINDCDTSSSGLTYDTAGNAFGCNTNLQTTSLADDNVWVGSAGGVATATTVSDCDAKTNGLTYDTTTNAVGCQSVPQKYRAGFIGSDSDTSLPGWFCTTQGFVDLFANRIEYGLIVSPETTTYTSIGINVTSSGGGGSIARVGLYEGLESSVGYVPGALIVDAGTVSTSTTGIKSITISKTLTRGQVYFTAVVFSSGTTQVTQGTVCSPPVSGLMGDFSGIPQNVGLGNSGAGTGAFSDPAPAPGAISGYYRSTMVRLGL